MLCLGLLGHRVADEVKVLSLQLQQVSEKPRGKGVVGVVHGRVTEPRLSETPEESRDIDNAEHLPSRVAPSA